MNAEDTSLDHMLGSMREVVDLAAINKILTTQLQQSHEENEKLLDEHADNIRELEERHLLDVERLTQQRQQSQVHCFYTVCSDSFVS